MSLLAGQPDRSFCVTDIARALPVSSNHLAKVLQRLVKEGFVRSSRGRGGGFAMAVDPGEVTLLQVYEAIEGPLATQECLFGTPVCHRKECILGPLLHSVGTQVRDFLSSHRLADLNESSGERT